MSDYAVKVFYSYCRKDELLRDDLAKYLSPLRFEGEIVEWYDRDINGGEDWDGRIKRALNNADLVLLLVSADFLASEYCYGNEIAIALERHKAGAATVIPILLRPVDWDSTPFAHLKPLPRNRKPISAWNDRDQAFVSVMQDIRSTVENIKRRKQGDRSWVERLKARLLPSKRAEPTVSTASKVKDYIRIRLECPSCGHPYYATYIHAGAQYRCRECGITDRAPQEYELMAAAMRQGKIKRNVQIQVLRRKLVKQDITLTGALLLKEELDADEAVDELGGPDIVEQYVPQSDEWGYELASARLAGIIPDLEKNLEEALTPGREYRAEEFPADSELTPENLTTQAEAAADALLDMAHGRNEKTEAPDDVAGEPQAAEESTGEPEPFRGGRVLCVHSHSDAPFGEPLAMHLAALEQDGPIGRLDTLVVDAPGVTIGSTEELIREFHIVLLLVSPAMFSTAFSQEGKITELLECHQLRDVVLIPVIVRPMAWQKMNLSKLQVLPAGGTPLASWSPVDEGCASVADALRGVIARLPLEIIVKVGERGDESAKTNLMACYAIGQGVKKNPEKAVYWTVRAAEASQRPGLWFVAGMALENREPAQALEWIKRAVAEGHGPAMDALANWYEGGTIVEHDPAAALEWRQKVAEAGDPQGMLQLARMYFDGIGTSVDDNKGTLWLKRAAELDDAMAMVHVGNSYYLGRGVTMDQNTANEWWQKAYATGNEEAIETLNGQGFQANYGTLTGPAGERIGASEPGC